jgi:hypothetical protein
MDTSETEIPNLPNDMILKIVSYIVYLPDWKNLSFVNRSFRKAVIAQCWNKKVKTIQLHATTLNQESISDASKIRLTIEGNVYPFQTVLRYSEFNKTFPFIWKNTKKLNELCVHGEGVESQILCHNKFQAIRWTKPILNTNVVGEMSHFRNVIRQISYLIGSHIRVIRRLVITSQVSVASKSPTNRYIAKIVEKKCSTLGRFAPG